jgi:hypothetical protein
MVVASGSGGAASMSMVVELVQKKVKKDAFAVAKGSMFPVRSPSLA